MRYLLRLQQYPVNATYKKIFLGQNLHFNKDLKFTKQFKTPEKVFQSAKKSSAVFVNFMLQLIPVFLKRVIHLTESR